MKKRIAYHEAGHFVAAYALGRRCTKIVLGKTLGHCAFGRWKVPGDADVRLRRQAMIYLAGMASELVHLGNHSEGGASQDAADAYECCLFLTTTKKGAKSLQEQLIVAVFDLLDTPEYRGSVEALAAALRRRKHLTGKQARKIIRTALA